MRYSGLVLAIVLLLGVTMRIGRNLTVTEINNIIVEYNQPALLLACGEQSIAHGEYVAIEFTMEFYDLLDMWAIGDPTKIYTPSDALWHVTLRLNWDIDNVGTRILQLSGQYYPAVVHQLMPSVTNGYEQYLSFLTHIDATFPISVVLWQNSGGNLDINFCQLLMARHVEYTYPIE